MNTKPLGDDYQYLLLDGLWSKAKGYGFESNKAVLLCALGIKPNGKREIVGFAIARAEDYESWHTFLLSLKERGLVGKTLHLIITDGADSLKAAADQLYPKVPQQLCIIHKMRNVLGKTSFKNKQAVAADLKATYAMKSKPEFLVAAKVLCKRWYLSEPKAVASFKDNLLDTATYFNFPEACWKQIRTNNILEREFREVRRRIKVFDSSFTDTNSMGRYADTIINYLNENYPAAQQSLHTHP